jgi:tetratricopeptide (TPR) repeat protein
MSGKKGKGSGKAPGSGSGSGASSGGAGSGAGAAPTSSPPPPWPCPVCSYPNDAPLVACEMCGVPRPEEYTPAPVPAPAPAPTPSPDPAPAPTPSPASAPAPKDKAKKQQKQKKGADKKGKGKAAAAGEDDDDALLEAAMAEARLAGPAPAPAPAPARAPAPSASRAGRPLPSAISSARQVIERHKDTMAHYRRVLASSGREVAARFYMGLCADIFGAGSSRNMLETLLSTSETFRRAGPLDGDAERFVREILEGPLASFDMPFRAYFLYCIAELDMKRRNWEAAEVGIREVVALLRGCSVDPPPVVEPAKLLPIALSTLGRALFFRGDFDESISTLQESRVLGRAARARYPDHVGPADACSDLGKFLFALGMYGEAEAPLREAAEVSMRGTTPMGRSSLVTLARVLSIGLGRHAEAESLLEEALAGGMTTAERVGPWEARFLLVVARAAKGPLPPSEPLYRLPPRARQPGETAKSDAAFLAAFRCPDEDDIAEDPARAEADVRRAIALTVLPPAADTTAKLPLRALISMYWSLAAAIEAQAGDDNVERWYEACLVVWALAEVLRLALGLADVETTATANNLSDWIFAADKLRDKYAAERAANLVRRAYEPPDEA